MDAVRVTAWAWEVELHGRGEMVENASMDAVRVMALAVLCHCDGIACIPHRMHLPPHASPTACIPHRMHLPAHKPSLPGYACSPSEVIPAHTSETLRRIRA